MASNIQNNRYSRPTWIEVSKNNIFYNVSLIKKYLYKFNKNIKLIAVVKGNAYGHTAISVAPTIIEAGADMLATGILEEAISLRKIGINCPILVLGYTTVGQAALIVEHDIIQNICTLEMAQALSDFAKKQNKKAKIHIKIDTGLGRLGIFYDQALQFAEKIYKMPNLVIDGIYTHLATAHTGNPEYCMFQVNKFKETIRTLREYNLPTGIKHLANSAAMLMFPEYHFDAVRCGSLLYGVYGSDKIPRILDLKPALSLHTKIVFMKKLPKESYIGYGNSFVTKRESTIGILPIGHADGLSKGFANKLKVLVRGKRAPLIDGINMDSCFVDLTDVSEAEIGDDVVIIGKQGEQEITVLEIAQKLHEDVGEVLVSLGNLRIPHVSVKFSGTINRG